MRIRAAVAVAAGSCAAALLAPAAHAALPGRDYSFSYFKDAGHSVLLDVEGRRTITGIGFSIAPGCVPQGTDASRRSIAVGRDGRFGATRALQSVESGRTVGSVKLRGRFTSSTRLVLRARFASGKCSTRAYRFVLAGSPPDND